MLTATALRLITNLQWRRRNSDTEVGREYGISPGWERTGTRSVRRGMRSVGWENWLRDDGGRVESGSLNKRRL